MRLRTFKQIGLFNSMMETVAIVFRDGKVTNA
jgi:hypothetical protein